MTKRSNPDNEAAPARADGGFNRVAGLVRASAEIARTIDRLAKIARQRIPISVAAGVPGIQRRREMRRNASEDIGSRSAPEGNRHGAGGNVSQSIGADAIHAISGFATKVKAIDAVTRVGRGVLGGKAMDSAGIASGSKTSIPSGANLSRENSGRESRWPEDTTGSSRGRFARMIQQSSLGIEALERHLVLAKPSTEIGAPGIEQGHRTSWVDLAGRAHRTLGGVGRFSIGSEEGSEDSVGKYLAASRASRWGAAKSSMVAPANLSRPEFAEPMRGVYGQESRSTSGSITINSTPTVVINANEGSGDVERQVIGALRAHRDELFDQFKRESVRRERAEF